LWWYGIVIQEKIIIEPAPKNLDTYWGHFYGKKPEIRDRLLMIFNIKIRGTVNLK
jgi:hypothetical protein